MSRGCCPVNVQTIAVVGQFELLNLTQYHNCSSCKTGFVVQGIAVCNIRSEAAFALRKALVSQTEARIIVLDLSEVAAVAGGGLGISCFCRDGLKTMTFDLNFSILVNM